MSRSVCSPFPIQGISHEKNVPALPKASCPPIRLSGPHGHQERSRDHQSPSGGGPQTSGGRRDCAQVCPSHPGLIPGGSDSVLTLIFSQQHSSAPTDFPKSESLPRARIIRRRTVFDDTRIQGRRVSNRFMALNFLRKDAVKTGETGTVAFLTPKRLGAATKRTQLRRRMREIYRRHLAGPAENAYLVWVARPPALELPFEELKKCMTALIDRSKGKAS